MKKAFAVNGVLLILLVAGAFIFDASLELGDLHGVVFRLYLVYGVAALLLGNVVAGGVYMYIKRRAQ